MGCVLVFQVVTFALSNDPDVRWARDLASFAPLSIASKYTLLWSR